MQYVGFDMLANEKLMLKYIQRDTNKWKDNKIFSIKAQYTNILRIDCND